MKIDPIFFSHTNTHCDDKTDYKFVFWRHDRQQLTEQMLNELYALNDDDDVVVAVILLLKLTSQLTK